jgi:hypothetical protein
VKINRHLTYLFFIAVVLSSISLHGQTRVDANSPKLLTIGDENDIELTLDPNQHRLLGIFLGRDSLISSLEVSDSRPFSVWVDGRLYEDDSTYHSLSLTEISDFSDKADTAFVSFYSTTRFQNFESRYVYRSTDNQLADSSIQFKKEVKNRRLFTYFFIFFLLLIGFFRYTSPSGFFLYFSKVFFRSIRVSTFDEDDSITVFEALIASCLVALAIWHILDGETPYLPGYERTQFFRFLFYTGMVSLFFIGKFLLLRFIAYLNGLGTIYRVQFVDFLKFILVSSIFLNVVFFALYWLDSTPEEYLSNSWRYLYPLLYLFFIGYYFFKLSAAVPGKKLLIISYLCTTEIVGAYIISSILVN